MAVAQLQQQNVAAAAAYTEYSLVVPAGVMQLNLQLRLTGSTGSATPANLFWYMASSPNVGHNAAGLPTKYNTIPVANSRSISGKLGGQTIYFQVDQTNQLLEVDYFSDI
jgi:hypothetical protein